MTLPSYPNQIDIESIRNEFSMPVGYRNLNSFHANNNAYVAVGTIGYPNGVATEIPTSGEISLNNFHGAGILTGSGVSDGTTSAVQALPNSQTWLAFKMIGGGGGMGGDDNLRNGYNVAGYGGAGVYAQGIVALPAGTKTLRVFSGSGGNVGTSNLALAPGGDGGYGTNGSGGTGGTAFQHGNSGGGGGGGGMSEIGIDWGSNVYYILAQAGGGGGGGGAGSNQSYPGYAKNGNYTAGTYANIAYNNNGWAGEGYNNVPTGRYPDLNGITYLDDGGGGGGGGGFGGEPGQVPVYYIEGGYSGKPPQYTAPSHQLAYDFTAGGGGSGNAAYNPNFGSWYTFNGIWSSDYTAIGGITNIFGGDAPGAGALVSGYSGIRGTVHWYWTTQAPIPTTSLSLVP